MDELKFTVINEDGKEVECEVLFTFEHDETGKNYVVYTDNTLDEQGNTAVFVSVMEEDGETLSPLETEEEFQMIEQMLDELVEKLGQEE